MFLTNTVIDIEQRLTILKNNLNVTEAFLFALDILIVFLILYWVYRFLKEKRAMRIVYGLFVLLGLTFLARILNLMLLNWILKYAAAMSVVAIPVVFQPELRSVLERLGRTKLIGEITFNKDERMVAINPVVNAVKILSAQKIGALFVLQRQTGLREYIERGTEIDATVSRDLLLSIFFPKSPLHDGAAIVVGNRVVSVRSILPVSESVLSPELGTRHKAAIGVTENSDALAIAVSEETGAISLAVAGKLERKIPEDRLKNRLTALLRQKKK